MTNVLKVVKSGADPYASDVNQLVNLLNGLIDVGALTLAGPQPTPAAPTVASGSAGNLNGAYLYKTVLITGWKQSDGSYYVSGFAPSADSSSITLTNVQGNLSGIATGNSAVIGRAIYRTKAGGTSGNEFFAGVIWDNTTTTWTDNVSDANVGTGMPTSSSSPAVYGNAIPSVIPPANTTGTALSANTNDNLLFNPTGALGLQGWTQSGPLSWQSLFGIQGSYFYLSGTVAANTWAYLLSSQIPFVAGQTITLSGIVDGSTLTSGSAYASIYAYNSSNAIINSYDTTARATAGQYDVPVSVTVTLPAGTAYVIVRLMYGNTASTAGTARWFNMKLEIGSMPTAFNDLSTLNTIQYGQSAWKALVGQKSVFRLTPSANQTITAGAATKALFATTTFDTLTETSSSRFTAKNSGTFRFNAVVEVTGLTTNGYVEVQFYKNGVPYSTPALSYSPTGGALIAGGSALIPLSVGDYVEVYVIGSNGTPVINTGTPSYFEGEQIA